MPFSTPQSNQDRPLIVLKFGSSVLPTRKAVRKAAVSEIRRHVDRGWSVIAVVSAIGDTTDDLIAMGTRFAGDSCEPEPTGLAALLATGEVTSAALLEIALNASGLPAFVLDPAQVRLCAEGPPLDSKLTSIDSALVRQKLTERPVAVLPGFYGRSKSGATSLLGRGGSDLTALFLGDALGAATCRLVKDVDGLYDRDPNAFTDARRYASISWSDAHALSSQIVQPKAIQYAQDRGLTFEVTCLGSDSATLVGECETALDTAIAQQA